MQLSELGRTEPPGDDENAESDEEDEEDDDWIQELEQEVIERERDQGII